MIERKGMIGVVAGLAMIPGVGSAEAQAKSNPLPYSSLIGCETINIPHGTREKCETFDVTKAGKMILRKIQIKTRKSSTEHQKNIITRVTSTETDTKYFNNRHKLVKEVDKIAVKEVVLEPTLYGCMDDATGEPYACSTGEQQMEVKCHQEQGTWIEQSTTDQQGFNLGVCRVVVQQSPSSPPTRPSYMPGPPVPPSYK